MSKRTVTEVQTSNDGQAFSKVPTNAARRDSSANNVEMGEFEDAWEDEIESDEDVVNGEGNDEGKFTLNLHLNS